MSDVECCDSNAENMILKIDDQIKALKKVLEDLLREVLLTNQYFLETVPKVGECGQPPLLSEKPGNSGWFRNHSYRLESLKEQIVGIKRQVAKLNMLTHIHKE